MRKTNVAKKLLLDKGCTNCLYCIKGSFEYQDWYCHLKERNTYLHDSRMHEIPEERSCEDHYSHVNDAHKRDDFWQHVERTHKKYISLMRKKHNGKLDTQEKS